MAASESADAQTVPAVRFNPVHQEISPPAQLESESLTSQETPGTPAHDAESREDISDEAKQGIRDLAKSLTHSNAMSSARMNHFVFDPVSLPPSRVCVYSTIAPIKEC